MHRLRHDRCCLAFLTLVLAALPARAESPPDPLRLVPAEADLFFKVENPRRLLDAVHYDELIEQLRGIPFLREQLESANVRRLLQFLAYYEKQLGFERMELLDRLAGGGVALGVKIGPNPAPALLVIQGRDEALMRKFLALTTEIVEAEIARQGAGEPTQRERYRDVEIVRFSKDAYAAVAGSALLVSNVGKTVQLGVDLFKDGGGKSLAGSPRVEEARKQLPPAPLAWASLNLETTLHKSLGDSKGPSIFLLLGGWFDVARRAPYLAAGFYEKDGTYLASVRMPRGRHGMPAVLDGHLPPAGQVASRPLLEPPGVLASASFYLDLAKLWEHRADVLDEQQLKGLNELEKNFQRLLAGANLGDLLQQVGTQHRLVVVHQAKSVYKTTPAVRLPAFAIVLDMRKPEKLGRSLEAILRAAALLAGTQVRLKLVEEEHGDRTIVGYRLVEGESLPGDPTNLRYNFCPCFVRVGNQFVVSSTMELGHKLVDLLEQEAKGAAAGSSSPARVQLYAAGGVALLETFEDQLVAQTVLGQAASPQEARQQVRALGDLVRKLGTLRLETNYGEQDFRFDITLSLQRMK
jgi:hypothetical protein